MSTEKSSSSEIGFLGLLAILFIGLKLGSVINWSWWWVTCPLWGPLALAIVFYVPVIIIELKAGKKKRETEVKQVSKWEQKLKEMQERHRK